MKRLKRLLPGIKNKFKIPEPKLDGTSPRTIFQSAIGRERLDSEELVDILRAIDSLRETPEAHSSTTRFVVDGETLDALIKLAFTTKYEMIMIAANVVINNHVKE
ncbi:hypothetical protein KKE92_04905 [Candidatus Micrarchaeota archaeon]|nr:hypothetical protein [Candidatus Micrarchaeota archaeon]